LCNVHYMVYRLVCQEKRQDKTCLFSELGIQWPLRTPPCI